ncbi:MAG: hypothetical protein J6J71_01850 [Prevotella sp.]|nr:hypothetical protein [Prevotella sp.]
MGNVLFLAVSALLMAMGCTLIAYFRIADFMGNILFLAVSALLMAMELCINSLFPHCRFHGKHTSLRIVIAVAQKNVHPYK